MFPDCFSALSAMFSVEHFHVRERKVFDGKSISHLKSNCAIKADRKRKEKSIAKWVVGGVFRFFSFETGANENYPKWEKSNEKL